MDGMRAFEGGDGVEDRDGNGAACPEKADVWGAVILKQFDAARTTPPPSEAISTPLMGAPAGPDVSYEYTWRASRAWG